MDSAHDPKKSHIKARGGVCGCVDFFDVIGAHFPLDNSYNRWVVMLEAGRIVHNRHLLFFSCCVFRGVVREAFFSTEITKHPPARELWAKCMWAGQGRHCFYSFWKWIEPSFFVIFKKSQILEKCLLYDFKKADKCGSYFFWSNHPLTPLYTSHFFPRTPKILYGEQPRETEGREKGKLCAVHHAAILDHFSPQNYGLFWARR